MAIKIDKNKCIGCGNCESLCPDCFELGDNRKAKVKKQDCASCDLKDVASACPADAISVK